MFPSIVAIHHCLAHQNTHLNLTVTSVFVIYSRLTPLYFVNNLSSEESEKALKYSTHLYVYDLVAKMAMFDVDCQLAKITFNMRSRGSQGQHM